MSCERPFLAFHFLSVIALPFSLFVIFISLPHLPYFRVWRLFTPSSRSIPFWLYENEQSTFMLYGKKLKNLTQVKWTDPFVLVIITSSNLFFTLRFCLFNFSFRACFFFHVFVLRYNFGGIRLMYASWKVQTYSTIIYFFSLKIQCNESYLFICTTKTLWSSRKSVNMPCCKFRLLPVSSIKTQYFFHFYLLLSSFYILLIFRKLQIITLNPILYTILLNYMKMYYYEL